ncbi:H2A protein, partial [Amia calva]|nr:H2A protein [Amia calva]
MSGRGKTVGKQRVKAKTRSSRSGLQFPVGRVHRLLRKGNYAQRVILNRSTCREQRSTEMFNHHINFYLSVNIDRGIPPLVHPVSTSTDIRRQFVLHRPLNEITLTCSRPLDALVNLSDLKVDNFNINIEGDSIRAEEFGEVHRELSIYLECLDVNDLETDLLTGMKPKGAFHRCSGCQGKLPSDGGHDLCVCCLGEEHAQNALIGEGGCVHCVAFTEATRHKRARN